MQHHLLAPQRLGGQGSSSINRMPDQRQQDSMSTHLCNIRAHAALLCRLCLWSAFESVRCHNFKPISAVAGAVQRVLQRGLTAIEVFEWI